MKSNPKLLILLFSLVIFSLTSFGQSAQKPDTSVPKNWQEISRCAMKFFVPKTLKDLKTYADDSCIAGFEDSNLRVSIDYGRFGQPYTKTDTRENFTEETIEIDAGKGQLVTFLDISPYAKQNPHRKFVAVLYVEVKNKPIRRALNMTISGKSKKELETARQIFGTLKFY